MPSVATSLKLNEELKTRIDKLARKRGESPHAYMILALEDYVARAEQAEAFLRDAIAADEEMQRSGLAYDAKEVHDHLAAKAAGKKTRRPKAKRWRA
jgi:predicted transcriptional regulator